MARYAVRQVDGGFVVQDGDLAYELIGVDVRKRSVLGELTVRHGDDVVHSNTFSLTAAKARNEFVEVCHARGAVTAEDAVLRELADFVRRLPPPKEAPLPRFEVLERLPGRVDRPLVLVGDHAYAVTWLPVREWRGEESEVVERQILVRDDGQMHGLEAAHPLEQAGVSVHLNVPLDEEVRWSSRGAMAYARGERPSVADVFERLVASYDHFIDFARSLAPQRVMCRLMACMSLETWLCDSFDNVTYFQAVGAWGSGKTKLLEVWIWTSYLGLMVTSGSTFATLRDVADQGGALAIDEAEFLSDPKKVDPHLRELILSGYRKSRSQILVNEQLPSGKWVMRRCRTFSPRAFAAIRLPDLVLGSRLISIPLVLSANKAKANRGVNPSENWPCDRDQLLADLWAVGLELQTQARAGWTYAGALQTPIHGRDYEPWRPLLAVAKLVEDAGADGVVKDILSVLKAYQGERNALTYGGDLNRLIVQVLRALGRDEANWTVNLTPRTRGDSSPLSDSSAGTPNADKRELRIVAKEVAQGVRAVLAEAENDAATGAEGEDDTAPGWPSPEQVGRALSQLRVGESVRDGRRRYRRLTHAELVELVDGYGGDSAFIALDPPATTVINTPTVTTQNGVSDAADAGYRLEI